MSKKFLAVLLSIVMICGCMPAFAAEETSGAEYEYPMQVAAKNDIIAIRLPYSDSYDVVQRIVNVFRKLNDPERISNNPVDFEKSFLIEKNADIWDETTTIYAAKEGAGDEAPCLAINDSYMAANHGHDDGMRVTAENHGLSFSDIGSRWYGKGMGEEAGSSSTTKVEKEIYWNLIRIVDENTLVFLSDDNGANRGHAYTFCSDMSGEYVREDDNSKKLNVTACSATQLQPSIRYKERKAYVTAKGMKLSVENGSMIDCDEFVIEECYDVIDPSTIADAIRENAPEGGYTSNPDISLGGESMLEYNIKYTFRADGTMLQEINHKVIKNMRIGHTPTVMHKMREAFTGGDIYRYLPNTIAFETETAINPGTTGTVTKGEKVTFDFSKRHKIASTNSETITYPYQYTSMKRSDCPDTEYPNERYIEYYTDADGDYSAVYAEGLLPVGYASKENWKNSTPDVFYFYKSLKSYPYTYSTYKQEAGTTLNAVSYKKYAPVNDAAGDTIDYSIAYGDTLYTYVDMFKTGESYTLPEGYTLFNKSANVEIEGNIATADFASGDTHAYVVVTSDYENPAASLTVDEVKAMLQAEALTAQPLNAVVSDIYLPQTSEDSPVSVVWSTTDPDVISAEGKITRDIVNEKKATIKAVISDGITTQEVSHDITVLPQKYDVYKASTLYYPDDDKEAPAMSDSLFPNISGATTLNEDEDGNYYVSYDFSKDALANGITAAVSTYTSEQKHQVVYLYTMIKPEGTGTNGIDVRMSVRNASNNALIANNINLARIKSTSVTAGGKTAGTLSATEFTPVIFKVDINNSSGAVKVGDGEWTDITSFASQYTYPTDGSEHFVGGIFFTRAAGSTPENTLMFSEGALYTEVDIQDVLSELTDMEKAQTFANLITMDSISTQSASAITKNLTLDASYRSFDLEALGIDISWKSDNTSVITDSGAVTTTPVVRKATMTAIVKVGKETIEKEFNLTVVPADTVTVEHEVLNQDFEAKELGSVPAADYAPDGNTATLTAEYITDEDTSSKVLHMANSEAGKPTYLTNSAVTSMNNINLFSNRYYISYDVKYERADKNGEGKGAYGFVGVMGYTGNLQASAQFHFTDRMIGFDSYDEEKNKPGTLKYPMPESLSEGEWFNVTIDYQPVSRSYQVYINGELINDVPAKFARVEQYVEGTNPVHVLRGVQFGCSQNGDLYVDNISTLKCTNKDSIQANAAKNVGLMLYAGNLENAITDQASLITAGPAENGTDIVDSNICNLAFTGESVISYKLDGEDVNAIDITEFGRKTLTVTGTYNGVTDTSSVTRTASTVVISAIDVVDNKPVLTLTGDFADKTVFIATYSGGRLIGIDCAEAASTINFELIVNEGESVRAFIMNAEAMPQAMKAKN